MDGEPAVQLVVDRRGRGDGSGEPSMLTGLDDFIDVLVGERRLLRLTATSSTSTRC
jgi:hypothetical protein